MPGSGEWLHVSDGPWSRRRKHQAVVWNEKLLLLGGFDGDSAFDLNDVWSFDGNNWELVTANAGWSGRDGHCAVVFNGSVYILGGTDDPYNCKCDVWKSDDGGLTWNQLIAYAPWPERWQHASCVHDGKMYVMGGWGERYLNDVWSSSNGIHWIQVCANAPWKPRMFLSSISFNGAIYVIGGHDGRMQLRDVWASTDDGVTWTQVCQVAQWEGRQGHSTVVLDGHVYLMGGFGGATRFNDLWKSSDCAHWSLVTRHCTWSPRQGHASIGYRGRIFILGGFDESGYTNNVYALSVTNSEGNDLGTSGSMMGLASGSSDSFDGNHANRLNRPVTVALSTVVESLEELRTHRVQREKLVSGLVSVVGLVMKAVTFTAETAAEIDAQSVENGPDYKSCSSDQDHTNLQYVVSAGAVGLGTTSNDAISQITSDADRASHAPKHRRILSSAKEAALVGKRGSPWREAFTDNLDLKGIVAATGNRLVKIASDEDLHMQIWRMLPENLRSRAASVDAHSSGAAAAAAGVGFPSLKGGMNVSPFSSAALRESMEKDRESLNAIQRKIRALAESGDFKGISELIAERTALADKSSAQAAQLIEHVTSVRLLQDARQKHLSFMLAKLESLELLTAEPSAPAATGAVTTTPFANPVGSPGSPSRERDRSAAEELQEESCSWADWEAVAQKCAESAKSVDCSATEVAVGKLREELRALARLTNELCEWMGRGDGDTPLDPWTSLGKRPSRSIEGFEGHDAEPKFYEMLMSDYCRTQENLDKRRMAAKTAIDNEIAEIEAAEPETRQLLRTTLRKGIALVNGMISQNRLDTMEIGAMETEVSDWIEVIECLKNRQELEKKCEDLVAENGVKEEQLLKLEDERIDIKSMLEKAALKGARVRKSSAAKGNPGDDAALAELEEIKEKHAIAEKAVRDARRSMRAWYREVKEFAVRVAPELFHFLPDLQTAGSLLGDGGFAENAKLPRRRLDEYDNVAPLMNGVGTDPKSLASMAGSARHVLLKATYDGEEVVLKGFIMHEGDQRKGLERELSILSRLRSDCIICPGAIVEDVGSTDNPYIQVAVFIEYPFYRGGNLSGWLKAAERKPWELQGIARQLLYGLLYLHDHNVIHRDIKPSNVLMHDDGRVVLADFELSREVSSRSGEGEEASTTTRSGTRGFMAPEIESGGQAVTASDMYSFGVLLLFMHQPNAISNLIPGNVMLPPTLDPELSDLIGRLLVLTPSQRPPAASALMHPYFRSTFVERLLQEGEVVEQDRKLEAVRDLFHRVRSENRTNLDRLSLRREEVVDAVLDYFANMALEKMRASLRLIFIGEPGVDEGGLLTEMFTIFFEAVLSGEGGLFEGPSGDGASSSSAGEGFSKTAMDIVLPCAADESPERLKKLRAFGRAMVKALYEGRRMGNRLCPSVFKFLTDTSPNMRDLQMFDPQTFRSLQWMLATIGVEEFGLHFEAVGAPELGVVTDSNKANFVRMKIDRILVKSRLPHLVAIKAGFVEAVRALSEEAAPFLQLLSHTDWRVMLCGDTAISGPQINATLRFSGFPKKSQIPQWLKEIILSSSEDHLRKFLVFVTGSPSLSGTARGRIEINVRYQARSSALPVAHTCFFHLDIPDYRDKETLQTKLIYAVQHATSFEIV